MIRYSQPSISKKDINSVISVLKSNDLTQGTRVLDFEKKLNKYCNSKYSVVVNSATSALHLACLSLNLQPNDIVWTSAVTFVSTVNSALFCGAKVELIDICLKTFNISIDDVEKKLKVAKNKNKLPKIIIPVHLAGNPCDLFRLHKLSKKYKFKIIEDASHALGSVYKKKKIGSCKFSDVTIFSFHAVKNITTGEGGACLTNNKAIYKKICSLRSHGINRKPKKKSPKWYYEQVYLGYNYRITDIQASLGLSQLSKINFFKRKRLNVLKQYKSVLKKYSFVKFQKIERFSNPFFHLAIIRVPRRLKLKLYKKFLEKKIETSFHYIPIYNHPYHRNNKKFLNSEIYYNECLSLPLHANLNTNQVQKILSIMSKIFNKYKSNRK